MLYQWDITREPMDRVTGLFWQVRTSTRRDAGHGRAAGPRRAGAVRARSTRRSRAAATNWRFERIAAIDRNILRLGGLRADAASRRRRPSVVIDEAVELAKRFGEADSPPFVNGVLDAIRGARRAGRGGAATRQDGAAAHERRATDASGRGLAGGVRAAAGEGARAARAAASIPIPTRYERTHGLAEIVAAHGEQDRSRSSRRCDGPVRIAGRVMTQRGHGKASFATLSDGDGRAAGLRARRTTWARRPTGSSTSSTAATSSAWPARVMRTRKGELSRAGEGAHLPVQGPPAAAREVARPVRRRDRATASATSTSWRTPTCAARSWRAAPMVAEIRRFLDERGYVEVETPMMQPDRRRRRGAALRHPPQRARHGPLPAHRPRAVPEAPGGGRAGAGLRDQPQLPQRGDLVDAQPRVHDARVLHRATSTATRSWTSRRS